MPPSLLQRFIPIDELSVGPLGRVLRVTEKGVGRSLILKELRLPGTLSTETRARLREDFVADLRRLRSLPQDLLLPVEEIQDRGDLCYALFRHRGERPLVGLLRTGTTLAPHAATRLVRQICRLLQQLSAAGLTFEALPAECLFVDRDLGLRWAHVSFAHLPSVQDLPAELRPRPNIHYLAPEQLAGNATQQNSLVFALGVLLYRLLTGAWPFAGETADELLADMAASETANPLAGQSGWPAELQHLLQAALDTDHRTRLPDLAHLAERLKALEGCLADAPPAAPSAPAASPPRRVPLAALALLGGLVLAGIALLALWLAGTPAREQTPPPPQPPVARPTPLPKARAAPVSPPPTVRPAAKPATPAQPPQPVAPRPVYVPRRATFEHSQPERAVQPATPKRPPVQATPLPAKQPASTAPAEPKLPPGVIQRY